MGDPGFAVRHRLGAGHQIGDRVARPFPVAEIGGAPGARSLQKIECLCAKNLMFFHADARYRGALP
jgi:hypothetical protein